ncbi:hypothetical protein Agub_g12263, partial [Astrephomene gubernaculifera]
MAEGQQGNDDPPKQQPGNEATPLEVQTGQAEDVNAAITGLEPPEAPYFRPYMSVEFVVTALGAILVIWSFCWLYVGAFWNPSTRLSNLHVAVLDCDVTPPPASLNASFAPLLPALLPAPLASQLLAGSVWNRSSPLGPRLLHWEPASCGEAGGAGAGCGPREAECVASLASSVLQGETWALLYFPANFTAAYLAWWRDSGVAGAGAGGAGGRKQPPTATYYYARGRDYSTHSYLSSLVLSSLGPALSAALTRQLAASPAAAGGRLEPLFLATGISIAPVDLAPVRNFGQHFASYIFCVLLWLGSSFVVAASYQFKLPTEMALAIDPRVGGGRQVRLRHLAWALLVKGLVAAGFMFLEMVLLCVVLWCLGAGGSGAQWHWSAGQAIAFGWYMSWSFLSVNAVLLHALGPDRFSSASAALLIAQLTSASAIMSQELQNRVFYVGQALPFFYGVRGFRSIFFGTLTDKMWINWLVLTAYNVVFLPLGLLLVVRRVWRNSGRGAQQ